MKEEHTEPQGGLGVGVENLSLDANSEKCLDKLVSNKPRAVGYTRVSSERQVENLSLDTQDDKIREFCDRNGWELVAIFKEEGESAKTVDRTKFMEMLQFCRQKKNRINVAVVYAVNRFARKWEDHAVAAAKLLSWGVKLRSVTEPIDETPVGTFMAGVFAGVAQLENDMKSINVTNGMLKAVRLGRWPFMVVIGYKKVEGSIVLDPEKAPLIREGFVRMSTGRYTAKQVLDELNALGLRTLKGKRISVQTFHHILRNAFYAGWVQVKKWAEMRQGQFEPLIDQATFDKVQAILANRRPTITPIRRNRPDFPLRGYVKCGKCGAPLTGGWSTGHSKRRYPYYHCSKHCAGMGILAESLEQKYLAILDKMRMNPALVSNFVEIILDVWREKHADALQRVEAAKQQQKKSEERRQRLVDAMVDGLLDKETFQKQSKRLEVEIAAARCEVEDARLKDLNVEEALEFAKQVVSDPAKIWQEASLDQRQRLQKVLTGGEIMLCENGAVGTVVTTPIHSVLSMVETNKSQLERLIVASWNQIILWLRQIDQVRRAAIDLKEAA